MLGLRLVYTYRRMRVYTPAVCMHVRTVYLRTNASAYTHSLARAAVRTPPRPWSPVMNDLRRLTLICHFISLIQPSRRTLCTAPISFHAPPLLLIHHTPLRSPLPPPDVASLPSRASSIPHPHALFRACNPLNQLFRRGSKKKGGRA